eukprot:gene11713-biopygen6926
MLESCVYGMRDRCQPGGDLQKALGDKAKDVLDRCNKAERWLQDNAEHTKAGAYKY